MLGWCLWTITSYRLGNNSVDGMAVGVPYIFYDVSVLFTICFGSWYLFQKRRRVYETDK